jgi:hypothetical protein
MRQRLLMLLLICAPMGCDHPINWCAFGGGCADAGPAGGDPPPGDDMGTVLMLPEECKTMIPRAAQIIMSNCTECHAPESTTDGGGFRFITDLKKLVNQTGPVRMQTLLKPKDPPGSLIFSRILDMSMPPKQISKRPSQDVDVPALRDFIMTCLPLMPPYPQWPKESTPADAGAEPEIVPCTAGNYCPDGGCCVFGLCRKSGEECGESPTLGKVPGICTNGSCVNGTNRCGSIDEACCMPRGLCTAPGALCGLNLGKCIACGGETQECCAFGGACKSDHNVCYGGGGGTNRPHCEACGLPGQICCGDTAVTARKKCDADVCTHMPGTPGLQDYCLGAPIMPPPIRQ